MADKPIYCGSGKKQSAKWLKVTINPDKLKEYIKTYEGNKFVKLNINIKDEPNQYGKDVEITIDTWEKESSQSSQKTTEFAKEIELPSTNDDLPF